MASQNKKRKLKNSNAVGSFMKNRAEKGPQRLAFFTPAQRKENNKFKQQID